MKYVSKAGRIFIVQCQTDSLERQQFLHLRIQALHQRLKLQLSVGSEHAGSKDFLVNRQYLLHVITVPQPVTQIKQVITYQKQEKQQYAQHDGNALVVGRMLHLQAIFTQRSVLRKLLVKSHVGRIVVVIGIQVFQGKVGYCGLIAHIQQNVIIGVEPLCKPFQFGSFTFTVQFEQRITPGGIDAVIIVHTRKGAVCIKQGIPIKTVYIAIVYGIGIIIGLAQDTVGNGEIFFYHAELGDQ